MTLTENKSRNESLYKENSQNRKKTRKLQAPLMTLLITILSFLRHMLNNSFRLHFFLLLNIACYGRLYIIYIQLIGYQPYVSSHITLYLYERWKPFDFKFRLFNYRYCSTVTSFHPFPCS